RSPFNVARLIVPESPEDAAGTWREWRGNGVLIAEQEPAFWWMREEYEGPDGERHTREGFFGLVDIEPYERGVVRPHERTHEAAKRSQLARQALAGFAEGDPVYEASDETSTTRLWRITDPEALAETRAALADRSLV